MTPTRRRRQARRGETGATLVEFAIVFPIAILLILGIIGGCFIAYQNSALHNGATAGARMASIETKLAVQDGAQYCESGSPLPIEKAVAEAAPMLTVNPNPLCSTSAGATTLTQSPAIPGDVNITVSCSPTCAAPTTSTGVALVFASKGIVAPFGLTYTMDASSTVPTVTP